MEIQWEMSDLLCWKSCHRCISQGVRFYRQVGLFFRRIRYRFPKPILWGYKTYFERQTQAIRVHVKVLSTLGFLVTGTFQPDVRGSASGISHPSMRQCWGSNHQQTCNIPFLSSHNWLNGFFSINGFPNTNGAIDGTHIAIPRWFQLCEQKKNIILS